MAATMLPTPAGEARAHVASARRSRATLVLGHGAGGGVEAADLVELARVLPGRGITVVRVEQPWRVAGRRVAGPPATLDRAWAAALTALGLEGPVVAGGRSAGARVACRTAGDVGASAVVALAFPQHPPGRPERSRLPELEACPVPTLVVQGERDPFGGPGDFPRRRTYDVHAVPGADHSFRVAGGRDRDATLEALAATVADWVLDRLG
jgi:predicted alpha/beta-hydrolase family hydrolase